MTNSNAKGKRGEREAAQLLRDLFGVEARRSQQYCGQAGDADLQTDTGIHFEVKRVERLNLYEAARQAESDSGGAPWVILHKRNRKPWVAILEPERLVEIAGRLAGERD